MIRDQYYHRLNLLAPTKKHLLKAQMPPGHFNADLISAELAGRSLTLQILKNYRNFRLLICFVGNYARTFAMETKFIIASAYAFDIFIFTLASSKLIR